VKKFFRTSICFVVGLLLFVVGSDKLMGVWLKKSEHRGGVAADVQVALDKLRDHRDRPRVVVIGDSVGRQLFRPGSERSQAARYMTTNASVTLAGQFYLARSAIERFPNLTDIYLVCIPFAFENNFPRAYTHDFLCGPFHTTDEVIEVFHVKHDIELSFAHVGRSIAPNLLAANSLTQPAFAVQGAGDPKYNSAAPQTADPEKYLTLLSAWMGPKDEPRDPAPPGKKAVYLSPVSQYYLSRLRKLCQEHHVHLHVLPAPISAEHHGFEVIDLRGIYDGPILNDIPADHLIDGIHFRKEYVPAERERFYALYHVTFVNNRDKPAVKP
jgi:hypothetical protein